MPKDDLDQLFLDAADWFRPVQQPEDWTKMAALLDRRPARKLRPVAIALVFLALLAGGFLLVRSMHPTQAACPGCSSRLVQDHHAAVSRAAGVSARGKVAENAPLANPSPTAKSLSGSDRSFQSRGRVVPGGSPRHQVALTSSLGKNQPLVSAAGANAILATPSNPGTRSGVGLVQPGASPAAIPSGPMVLGGNAPIGVIPFNMPSIALEVFGRAPVSLSDQSPPVPKIRRPAMIRWQADLLLGPDLTLVTSSLWSNPGMDAGIRMSYHFSEKWQLESALLYSSKIYKALPSEYHPIQPYTGMPDLQQINANCRVIDLALDVRYNFKTTLGGTWFAEAGLSSYWMNREAYTFNYKSGGYPTSTSLAISNMDRHPLSILNLSAGYEFRLSRRVSWQVQPFLKLPLSGIGYGRVHLVSTGMLFSINYGL
ncbi:MAG TPA: hypothetical protein VMV20_05915 [Chitinophagaceae bacterium]|nr:hypothetical protein [Chitinophagaceae bacterium]